MIDFLKSLINRYKLKRSSKRKDMLSLDYTESVINLVTESQKEMISHFNSRIEYDIGSVVNHLARGLGIIVGKFIDDNGVTRLIIVPYDNELTDKGSRNSYIIGSDSPLLLFLGYCHYTPAKDVESLIKSKVIKKRVADVLRDVRTFCNNCCIMDCYEHCPLYYYHHEKN